jgi:hypothetical protein
LRKFSRNVSDVEKEQEICRNTKFGRINRIIDQFFKKFGHF